MWISYLHGEWLDYKHLWHTVSYLEMWFLFWCHNIILLIFLVQIDIFLHYFQIPFTKFCMFSLWSFGMPVKHSLTLHFYFSLILQSSCIWIDCFHMAFSTFSTKYNAFLFPCVSLLCCQILRLVWSPAAALQVSLLCWNMSRPHFPLMKTWTQRPALHTLVPQLLARPRYSVYFPLNEFKYN